MAKAPITKRTVDAAQAASAEYVIWDHGGKETVKGFGLKVTPAGSKVYIFRYRLARPGKAAQTAPRKYTIGQHGRLTPDQARTRAKELAALVEAGRDPRQLELDELAASDEAALRAAETARVEGELAFEKVAARWLDHYENEKGKRPSSVRLAKLVVNNHLEPSLKGRPMPRIGRADLQPIIDAIPSKKKGMRRLVFAYSSILFGWAHKRGDIVENPLLNMLKPPGPKARKRVLNDEELGTVWRASETLEQPYGAFFRLLILTGQRRGEVAAMNWAELDRASATWEIPGDRAKNNTDHIVPLSPAVVAELDQLALASQDDHEARDATRWPKSGFAVSTRSKKALNSFSQAKSAIDEAIIKCLDGTPMEPWRVHDLRRTLATGLQRLGVRFEVTEAVQNRVSGAKGGVAGIYQRYDWAEEKRSALDAWARHVAAIIKPGDKKNVVPIGAAKQSA